MRNPKNEIGSWLVVLAVVLLFLGAAVARSLGVGFSGVALGLLLAALGLRLAVVLDAVRGPAAPTAAGQVPAPGRHPERLHPAHV